MKKTRVILGLAASMLVMAGVTLSQSPDDALDPVRVAGDTHTVALDNGPRHHRDFRSPRSIMRRTDGYPPPDNAEKSHEEDERHTPLTGQPERPDRERRKDDRESQTEPGRRQI